MTTMEKTDKKGFSSDIEPLAGNDVLIKPVDEMTLQERTQAHVVLKFLEGRVKARLEALRGTLLADAEQHGEPVMAEGTATGSFKLYVDGSKVYKKKVPAKEPPFGALTDLLAKKKIAVEKAYDKVPTYVYNQSKVAKLVADGAVTAEEIEALKKTTWSLVVQPDPALKKLLETAAHATLEGGEEE